jgi:hypothetical protein
MLQQSLLFNTHLQAFCCAGVLSSWCVIPRGPLLLHQWQSCHPLVTL